MFMLSKRFKLQHARPPIATLRLFHCQISFKMKHHLMIGTWTPPGAIFTVAFDDEDLSLTLVKRTAIPEDEPISWMALSHTKKTLYGASMKKWSSHTIHSPSEITHDVSHPIGGDPAACRADTNTRAIFLLPSKTPPYNVYCNPFYKHAGYGNIFSTTPTGSLSRNIQNYPYADGTGIHGMVFDPTETFLYSADLTGNKIWTHKKGKEIGELELVGCLEAPDPTDHPRWVEMHPSGGYLYVLMEAGNRLGVYVIDENGLPVWTRITYPLVPPGAPGLKNKMYRSDVCTLSYSGKYLYATARSNHPTLSGYISAFKLSPTGAIERQICMNPTPTSGGHSNAVSPCDWSDEWLALTDDEKGGVEIYRWQEEFLVRIARLELEGEKGFGMNAVWYD